MLTVDDLPPIRHRRPIRGMSEVLLPIDAGGAIAWDAFTAHVARTAEAGLTPAVNLRMDDAVGADEGTRNEVLRRTSDVLAGREFVAGAAVADRPGAPFALKDYVQQIEAIDELGGTPLLIPSYGLSHQDAEHVVNDYEAIAACCERFLACELDERIAPSGRIYPAAVFDALVEIPQCIGIRHVSFRRMPQWRRLKRRDQVRPDFLVLSGNELALDLVTYGSDYLLAISALAPDWFAVRDRLWERGDVRFYELNDLLQYLARFAFRDPVAGFRDSATQFCRLRGWIDGDQAFSQGPQRPASDVDVLRDLLIELETYVDEIGD